MFPMATEIDPMHGTAQLMDFSNLVIDSISSMTVTPGNFSTTRAEYLNPKSRVLGSLFGINSDRDNTTMETPWGLGSPGECTCHEGVMELLRSMRHSSSSNEQRLSLDAQLPKLNRCIVSFEMSMGCAHGREDSEPIHIVAIAMLIGYVIDHLRCSPTSPRRADRRRHHRRRRRTRWPSGKTPRGGASPRPASASIQVKLVCSREALPSPDYRVDYLNWRSRTRWTSGRGCTCCYFASSRLSQLEVYLRNLQNAIFVTTRLYID